MSPTETRREVEPLTARHDGGRPALDLLRFRGGEGEDDPRRRLLQDLEERVPRVAREHVRLVEDVDLVAVLARGRVRGPAPQVARVLDAAMAGRIDLHHVEGGAAGPDPLAGLAHAARFTRRLFGAVERHGEDPGARRLADAAGAAEEIRVADPAGPDRGRERRPDVVLADQIGEATGPVGSGKRGAVHGLVGGVGRPDHGPQAGRGDRHTLTAATFTVLTGFTRFGPTGLGHGYLIRPPRQRPEKSDGVLSVEGVGDVLDSAAATAFELDRHDVEPEFGADARVPAQPGPPPRGGSSCVARAPGPRRAAGPPFGASSPPRRPPYRRYGPPGRSPDARPASCGRGCRIPRPRDTGPRAARRDRRSSGSGRGRPAQPWAETTARAMRRPIAPATACSSTMRASN